MKKPYTQPEISVTNLESSDSVILTSGFDDGISMSVTWSDGAGNTYTSYGVPEN